MTITGASPATTTATLTTIFDPVAQTHIDCSSENKVAHSMPMLPPLAKGETNVTRSFTVFAGGGFGAGGPGPVTTYDFKTHTESGEASSADIKTQ